jgi:O-antigen ligase
MLLAVAWGAFAFGAVYVWAYTPLMIGAAVIGATALVTERSRPVPTRALAIGFAAIALAALLQTVPLPYSVLSRVSPGTVRYLTSYDIGYRIAVSGGTAEDPSAPSAPPPSRAISLVPDKTLLGVGLFAALAIFLLGAMRIVSAVGALAVTRGLVLIGTVLAIFGVVQYALSGGLTSELKIYGFWTPRYHASPFGPFVNRNHFAGWMIMVIPLALTNAYASVFSDRRSGVRNFVSWLSSSSSAGRMQLMLLGGVMMVVSVLISNSRSGMAAAVLGLMGVAYAFMRRQSSRRARIAIIVAAAALMIGAGVWVGVDRLTTRAASVSGDLSTAGGRMGVWRDSLRIVRDFASAGVGLDGYGQAMILYQTSDLYVHYQEAHNDYLQLAAEGGLLVGLPILVTLFVFVRDVRQRFREAPKDGTTYWIRVGAVIGLCSIGLQALVEFSLQMPGNAALFCVLAAIALHRSPNLRVTGSAADRERAITEYLFAPRS